MLSDLDGWEITRTVRSDPYLATFADHHGHRSRHRCGDKILGLELGATTTTASYNPREVVARRRTSAHSARHAAHLRLHVGELIMVSICDRVMLAGNEIELTGD